MQVPDLNGCHKEAPVKCTKYQAKGPRGCGLPPPKFKHRPPWPLVEGLAAEVTGLVSSRLLSCCDLRQGLSLRPPSGLFVPAKNHCPGQIGTPSASCSQLLPRCLLYIRHASSTVPRRRARTAFFASFPELRSGRPLKMPEDLTQEPSLYQSKSRAGLFSFLTTYICRGRVALN